MATPRDYPRPTDPTPSNVKTKSSFLHPSRDSLAPLCGWVRGEDGVCASEDKARREPRRAVTRRSRRPPLTRQAPTYRESKRRGTSRPACRATPRGSAGQPFAAAAGRPRRASLAATRRGSPGAAARRACAGERGRECREESASSRGVGTADVRLQLLQSRCHLDGISAASRRLARLACAQTSVTSCREEKRGRQVCGSARVARAARSSLACEGEVPGRFGDRPEPNLDRGAQSRLACCGSHEPSPAVPIT